MGQREDSYGGFLLIDHLSEIHAVRAPRPMRVPGTDVEVWQEVSFSVPGGWETGGLDAAKAVIDLILKSEGLPSD